MQIVVEELAKEAGKALVLGAASTPFGVAGGSFYYSQGGSYYCLKESPAFRDPLDPLDGWEMCQRAVQGPLWGEANSSIEATVLFGFQIALIVFVLSLLALLALHIWCRQIRPNEISDGWR